MDRWSGHKGNLERSLLTARARIGTLLECGTVTDESVRTELEEIAALIRSIEMNVGKKRLGESRLKHPTLDFLASGLPDDQAVNAQQLLEVYTDCDLVAAEGNKAISPRKLEGSHPEFRRKSTQELDARVASVLSSPGASELLEEAGSLEFNALAFGALPYVHSQPIFVLFTYLEGKLRLSKQLRDLGQVADAVTFHSRLMHFMERMDSLYRANPYHNSAHAADVIMTLEWFFQSRYLQERHSSLDHLMALIAGAIHDVGHPGTSNLFQSKTMSPMAIRYNDKSILENMHVSLSFEAMRDDPNCNWFAMLPLDFRQEGSSASVPPVNLSQYVRKGLVHMVLATDMAKHAQGVQELKIFVEDQAETSGEDQNHKQEALDIKLTVLGTILHAADISSPTKPRPIMLQWTQRILEEFWNQGDEEQRRGLTISPLCNREAERIAVPKGQIGFITYVVQPLFAPLTQLMPEVKKAYDLLLENRAFWEEEDKEHATFEKIFGVDA